MFIFVKWLLVFFLQMPPLCALLSAKPSRAEDTNSARYGYCELNNSQQRSEAEASAACRTKLRVSSIVSALHQTIHPWE